MANNFLERAKVAYMYPRTQENYDFLVGIHQEATKAEADRTTLFRIGSLIEGFKVAMLSGKVDYSPPESEE